MPGEYLPPVVTRLTGDLDDLIRKVEEAKAVVKSLADMSVTIPVRLDLNQASVSRVKAAAKAAFANGVTVPVNFDANLGSAAGAGIAGRAVAGGFGGRGFGWIGFLRNLGGVNLFGGVLPGILGAVGGIHLLIDSILEVFAVVLPATIALGAFGIAASDAVNNIIRQFTAIHTVSDATGKSIAPLSGAMEALHKSVQPEVYSVLGDALTVINNKTGEFALVATQAAQAVSYFGARATVALTSSGMSQFMKNAASDLTGLFNVFGNIAGIIGNVLKQLPGYAEVLLRVLQDVTGGIENLTGSAIGQKIIGFGLSLHGAFLYIGLAATAFSRLMPGVIGMVGRLADRGALGAVKLGFTGAADGLARFGGLAETAAALPWGWIGLAAAAIGVLTFAIITSKDATQQWLGSLQAVIDKSSIATGLGAIGTAQTQVAERLTTAQNSLAASTAHVQVTSVIAGKGFSDVTTKAQANSLAVQQLTSGQKQLSDESNLYQFRLGILAGKYGGVQEAQNLLTKSGVTMKQMLDGSSQAWKIIQQQVSGVVQGYAAMAQRGGVLGADLYVITHQATDQFKAMQSLNQSWSTFIGLSTGLETSANQVVQAMRTVTTESNKAHTSFTGVNNSSIAMRQTFESQLVPQLQNVIGSMRQGGASSHDMGEVISTFLSPAVHEGALQNAAMRQQIYDMARQAGFTGPDAIRPLTNFINTMKTSLFNAMQMVDRTSGALNSMPKTEHLKVLLTGQGTFSIGGVNQRAAQPGKTAQIGAAAGAYIRHGTTPTADDMLARVSKGELIVPAHMVNAGAVNHLRGKIPGFAAGGFVPNYHGSVGGMGPWVKQDYSASVNLMAGAMSTAMKAAMAKAAAAVSKGGFLHPTGSGGSVEQLMKSMAASIGWTGSLWTDLFNVEMREAGFNLSAKNPNSDAYGLAQFINGPSEYAQYGGNLSAAGQITAMFNYIKATYGSPAGAWAHELNFGWYDKGGILPPGLTLAANATGHNEYIGNEGGEVVEVHVFLDSKELFGSQQMQGRRYNRRNGVRGTNKAFSPG